MAPVPEPLPDWYKQAEDEMDRWEDVFADLSSRHQRRVGRCVEQTGGVDPPP